MAAILLILALIFFATGHWVVGIVAVGLIVAMAATD